MEEGLLGTVAGHPKQSVIRIEFGGPFQCIVVGALSSWSYGKELSRRLQGAFAVLIVFAECIEQRRISGCPSFSCEPAKARQRRQSADKATEALATAAVRRSMRTRVEGVASAGC